MIARRVNFLPLCWEHGALTHRKVRQGDSGGASNAPGNKRSFGRTRFSADAIARRENAPLSI
jgi:hypothetical protein